MMVQSLIPFDPLHHPAIELSVQVDRRSSLLQVSYKLTGAVDSVDLPLALSLTDTGPERRMGLWEKTCFEFFLAIPGQLDYWEVNLSPAGHWNVFRLDGYRSGLREELAIETLSVTIDQPDSPDGPFVLNTILDLNLLGLADEDFDLAATSVIIDRPSGDVSYWALVHKGQEADFHLRDSFVMALKKTESRREIT